MWITYTCFDGKGKFIACSCNEHLSNSEYDKITSKIIDHFLEAGLFKNCEHFEKMMKIK